MSAKIYRFCQFFLQILFSPFLFVHCIFYLSNKDIIDKDLDEMDKRHPHIGGGRSHLLSVMYYLFTSRYYRTLFYHRIGLKSVFIQWYLPGHKLFFIRRDCEIKGGVFVLNHPYGTVLNAKKIGSHFTCRHLTTLGNKVDGRGDLVPTIGNHVTLGVGVIIIGGVHIGDYVTVGAGTLIIKDVPSNCVVVGNPARIIEMDGKKVNIPL